MRDLLPNPSPAHRRGLRKRGFTLIEMIVVIAVIAILGIMTTWLFGSMRARRSLHDAAREVVSQVHRLRSVGIAGRLGSTGFGGGGGGPLNASLTGATAAFQQTGIRVDNDQTLTFFGAVGGAGGGASDIIAVIDLDEQYPDGDLRITTPGTGTEIRFRRNATLEPTSGNTIVLTDQASGNSVTVRITLAGVPRIL